MASIIYFEDGEQLEFPLVSRDTTVGRAKQCTIPILSDGGISRYHCTVQRQEDGSFVLLDEESRNGTFHNGTRIFNGERVLADGDKIKVSDTVLLFVDPESKASQPGPGTVMLRDVSKELDDLGREMEEKKKGFKTMMGEITGRK